MVNSVFIGALNELGEFELGITVVWWGVVLVVVIGGGVIIVVVGVWVWLFLLFCCFDGFFEFVVEQWECFSAV